MRNIRRRDEAGVGIRRAGGGVSCSSWLGRDGFPETVMFAQGLWGGHQEAQAVSPGPEAQQVVLATKVNGDIEEAL